MIPANENSQKRCVIVGMGLTGLSCARYLATQGLDIAMMDTRDIPPMLGQLQDELPGVVVKTGGLDSNLLDRADIVVVSPGVDLRSHEFESVRKKGIEIVGDIELFARVAKAPIVAITGSNGKSTVTTLLAMMAQVAGKDVKVGGNLGTPVLSLLEDEVPDFYVLELSSFQLESIQSLNAFASTVLNISPDHMDRYDSIEAYQQAKQRIFDGDGVMVLNLDDPAVMGMQRDKRNTIGYSMTHVEGFDFGLIHEQGKTYLAQGSDKLLATDKMLLAGKHNVANALACLALGSVMALPMDAMLKTLEVFKGLPHRCRLVKKHNEISWYNDSKATNVGACIAAIEGLAEQGPIILIAGGVGKGQSFEELSPVLQAAVKAVILMGEASDEIEAVIPSQLIVKKAENMQAAVAQAAILAEAGDSVLLSPACASFDMFDSYSDRGQQFEKAVKEAKYE